MYDINIQTPDLIFQRNIQKSNHLSNRCESYRTVADWNRFASWLYSIVSWLYYFRLILGGYIISFRFLARGFNKIHRLHGEVS